MTPKPMERNGLQFGRESCRGALLDLFVLHQQNESFFLKRKEDGRKETVPGCTANRMRVRGFSVLTPVSGPCTR